MSDKIDRLEAAIEEKYGKEATIDLRKEIWEVDRQKIKEQLLALDQKEREAQRRRTFIAENGYLISEKIITRKSSVERICPVCQTFSFSAYDDVYMMKYQCCFDCFILHVDGREEKWQKKLEATKNEEGSNSFKTGTEEDH